MKYDTHLDHMVYSTNAFQRQNASDRKDATMFFKSLECVGYYANEGIERHVWPAASDVIVQ